MKKENVVALIVGIALCAGLAFIVTHPEKMDDMVLLEKQHPGYWNNLSDQYADHLSVPDSLSSSYDQESLHNIIEDLGLNKGGYSGVFLSADNGTLYINGTASEDIWPSVTPDRLFPLSDGTYYFSVGGKRAQSFGVYLEGWKGDTNKRLSWPDSKTGLYNNTFIADRKLFDNYKISIPIGKNETVDGSITPVLVKLSNNTDNLQRVCLWRTNKEMWNNLPENDKEIFVRRINEANYKWASVIFEDGTGVQIINGESVNGIIDDLGRVKS